MTKKVSQLVSGSPAAAMTGADEFSLVQAGVSKGGTLSQLLTFTSASPTFTGTTAAPTPTVGDNTTKIATTAFVTAAVAAGGGGGGAVSSVNTRTGAVTLTLSDIPGAAPLASPALTGAPTAPTPSTADNSTNIATTAYVQAQAYAPLASPALTGAPTAPTQTAGNNTTRIATTAFVVASFLTIALAASTYAPLASPILTGIPVAPTPPTADNSTNIATTAFVKAQAYAPLASPALTGTPTAPTASPGDNTTNIATTAFVTAAVAAGGGGGGAVSSVAGRTGAVVLAVADVSGAAPLASPTFTGTVTHPDASTATSAGFNNVKSIGIGIGAGAYPFDNEGTTTVTSGVPVQNNVVINANPASGSSATYVGYSANVNYNSNQNLTGSLESGSFAATHNGTGTVTVVYGAIGGSILLGNGTITVAQGLYGQCENDAQGQIVTGYGGFFRSYNANTLPVGNQGYITSIGVAGIVYNHSGTKVTNAYSVLAQLQSDVVGGQIPIGIGINVATPVGLSGTGSSTGYNFTVSTTNVTAGATYTNNGQTFTVVRTIAGVQGGLITTGTGAPTASSGTLTKASGTGDATIAYFATARNDIIWDQIYGIRIFDQKPSGTGINTLTNPTIALEIDSQTATGAIAIRQAGSGLNSFAGASTFTATTTFQDGGVWSATGIANSFLNNMTVLAGTATVAGLTINNGVLLTTPVPGAVEYDNRALYFTINNGGSTTSRCVMPAMALLSINVDKTGGNVTTAQTWFPGGGATTITVPANTTYFFEGRLILSRSAGTTAHTISMLFGGTATITSIDYRAQMTDEAATSGGITTTTSIDVITVAATGVVASSANASQFNTIFVKGIVRINASGTFIPQFQYSAAPGGAPTVKANSYFSMYPLGAGTVLSIGNWA